MNPSGEYHDGALLENGQSPEALAVMHPGDVDDQQLATRGIVGATLLDEEAPEGVDTELEPLDFGKLEKDLLAYYYNNSDRSLTCPCVESLPDVSMESVRQLLAMKTRFSSLKLGEKAKEQVDAFLETCTVEPRPMYIVAGHMRDGERDRREAEEDMAKVRAIVTARMAPCATSDLQKIISRLKQIPQPKAPTPAELPAASRAWMEKMDAQDAAFKAYDFDGELARLAKEAPEPPKATGLSWAWGKLTRMVGWRSEAEAKYEARLEREKELHMARRLGIAPKAMAA